MKKFDLLAVSYHVVNRQFESLKRVKLDCNMTLICRQSCFKLVVHKALEGNKSIMSVEVTFKTYNNIRFLYSRFSVKEIKEERKFKLRTHLQNEQLFHIH